MIVVHTLAAIPNLNAQLHILVDKQFQHSKKELNRIKRLKPGSTHPEQTMFLQATRLINEKSITNKI